MLHWRTQRFHTLPADQGNMNAAIRFLLTKNLSIAVIHRELCAVYGPNIISDNQTLSKSCVSTKPMDSALDFHLRYDSEGEEFFNIIVTDGETWMAYVT